MTDEHAQQAAAIVSSLVQHPRVEYQGIFHTQEQLNELRGNLPFFLPFRDATYVGLIPVFDWDHRLPSQQVIFRLYAYYSMATLTAGQAEFNARLEQIQHQDRFPEFDIQDFAELTADEAYEGEVNSEGKIEGLRLISSWRREIDPEDAQTAVQLVRRSGEFHKLNITIKYRPDFLGDLEAVSWTPPCESSYPTWTIDVWYLMDINPSAGKGRSFLVDLARNKVIGMREFVVRSG
jgi:hypothetical protein